MQAAILPEHFGEYQRRATTALAIDDKALWDEFGLEQSEQARYGTTGAEFTLTAFRLKDPTGAFAAFQWQRPADAQSAITAASMTSGALILHHNYLLRFEGGKPHPASLAELYKQLPAVVRSSLPILHEYLPRKGRVPNSERYLLGPVSLARFEPRIAPSLAAFERGAEGQSARYRLGGREVQLTIVSYPTPQMAIERTREYEKLAGAAVKRSGPMVIVVPEAPDVRAAERLMNDINYAASFTWNENAPKATVQDAARMILAISLLALGLIVSSVLLGMFFGGSRFLLRRFGMKDAAADFTTLNLSGK